MANYEIHEKNTEYDYDKEKDFDYCTNPLLNEAGEIKKTSWLDDYGWI